MDIITTGSQQQSYLPFRGVENDNSLYLPLDPTSQELRYLRLHPGEAGDPISCSLDHTTLEKQSFSRACYEALSYCWGDITDTIEIDMWFPKVNSGSYDVHRFYITRNLHDALHALRFTGRDRNVWIDAICISQNDPKEKTHQVGLLSSIFSSALGVIVWLGTEDASSRIVMRCSVHLHIFLAEQHIATLPDRIECMVPSDLAQLWGAFVLRLSEDCDLRADMGYPRSKKLMNASICIMLYNSIDQLLARPWFRRIWVFQEVLLSPRNFSKELSITILVGSSTMSWRTWADLTRLCFKSPCVLKYQRGSLTWFNDAWFKSTMMRGFANYAYYFDSTRNFLSSDPRDRLFALLHIAADTRDLVKSNPKLQPNYEKSLDTILLDFAECGIVAPLILKTSATVNATHEHSPTNLRNGISFSFELLYPADPYLESEQYDKCPSPLVHGQIFLYGGSMITSIAQKLDIRLGRSWCRNNKLPALNPNCRIERVIREIIRVLESRVPESTGFAFFRDVLLMIGVPLKYVTSSCWLTLGIIFFSDIVCEWPKRPVLESPGMELDEFERSPFWSLAYTGSWSPHNGYGAPQLFVTADNRLVLGSNEVQIGDFVVQMSGSTTPFMMAADQRQQNPRVGDYRFEGVCSFYPGKLLPLAHSRTPLGN